MRNPKFAFLDEATYALDEDNQEHLYQLVKQSRIGFISVGHRSTLMGYHDRILLLDRSGSWKLSEAVPGQPGMSKPAPVAVIEDGKAQAWPLYSKLFGRKPRRLDFDLTNDSCHFPSVLPVMPMLLHVGSLSRKTGPDPP